MRFMSESVSGGSIKRIVSDLSSVTNIPSVNSDRPRHDNITVWRDREVVAAAAALSNRVDRRMTAVWNPSLCANAKAKQSRLVGEA